VKGKDKLLHSFLRTKMKKKTKTKHLLCFYSCWDWDLCRAQRLQDIVLGEAGSCLEQQTARGVSTDMVWCLLCLCQSRVKLTVTRKVVLVA